MPTEKPEECSNCGTSLGEITDYGNSHISDWLCIYCANAYQPTQNKTLCSLLNLLEHRLKSIGE